MKKGKKRPGKYEITVMILIALIIAAFTADLIMKSRKPVQKTGFLLDTVVSVTLYDKRDEDILDGVYELCRSYEEKMSPTIKTSDVYRMNNRAAGQNRFTPDPSVLAVIQKGLEYSEKTDGAFDITVEPESSLWDFKAETPELPDKAALENAVKKVGYRNVRIEGNDVVFLNDDVQIDPGAVAKGYIADRLKEYLLEKGVKSAVINLGGNVLCVGRKPDGNPFTIGIMKPYSDHSETVKNLKIDDLSVVSSGVYERHFEKDGVNYHHILDPKTGMPYENGITEVTIVGPLSAECDALSTSCFSLGTKKGMELLNGTEGYYGYFILDDGTVLPSANAV